MPHRLPRVPLLAPAAALAVALALGAALAGCRDFQRAPVDWPLPEDEAGHGFFEHAGGKVHYRLVGDGPPVLLVHGFASAMVVWDPLVPALCRDHRCVLVDLPGFGWSDKHDRDYAPEALAGTLAALLDHLGERQPVAVVAHSWGCSVALALALEHPQRVGRLVLASAWAYAQQLPTFFEWARVPGVGAFLWDWFYTEQAAYKYANAWYEPDRFAHPAVVEKVHEAFERPGAIRAAHAAARAQRFEHLQARYPTIPQPALLVWGAEDTVSELAFGERLASELPRARLEVLARCGHLPMIEHAGRFAALVTAFVDGRELTAPAAAADTAAAAAAAAESHTGEQP
jgi:pimeloyl-ACP methyl ester carboxylesterase